MYCTNCGQKVSENYKYCMNCGKPISPVKEESDIQEKKSIKYYFRPNLVKLLLSLNLIWFLIHLFILLYQEHYESARNEFWYPYGYENHGYYDWTEFTIYNIGFIILSLIILLLFKQEEIPVEITSLKEMDPEKISDASLNDKKFENKVSNRLLKGLLITGLSLSSIYFIIYFLTNKAKDNTEFPTSNIESTTAPNVPAFVKKEQPAKTVQEAILEFESRAKRWTKIINGKWKGNAFQYDIQDSWNIRFSADFKKSNYKVDYPSLGCSGIWTVEKVSDNFIEFREKILSGTNICNDGGLVRLTIIDNKTLEFKYYTSYSTELNSSGTLKKL